MDKLELGKMLAAELKQTDTLGRWMAHYLAELITSLEQKTGSERDTAEAEVADLILRLWLHRGQLPGNLSPLGEVDKVEAAIKRLAPEREPWAYFGAFPVDTKPTSEDTETSTTLKAALLVDRLAGDLVYALIIRAAELAKEHDAAWVEEAEKIGDHPLLTAHLIGSAAEVGGSEVKRLIRELSSTLVKLETELEGEDRGFPDKGCN